MTAYVTEFVTSYGPWGVLLLALDFILAVLIVKIARRVKRG